jgi:hypothetical protein
MVHLIDVGYLWKRLQRTMSDEGSASDACGIRRTNRVNSRLKRLLRVLRFRLASICNSPITITFWPSRSRRSARSNAKGPFSWVKEVSKTKTH